MKLIDKAKDSRLTHLLQETNNFLKTLSDSVREQQQHVATFNIQNNVGENVSKADFDENEDEENIDYYAIAHKIREVVNTQPNILVGGRLKEYQLKGLEWMVSLFNNNLNGILADEMGLGKTIQTISLVTHLIDAKKINGPYLIIVPLSTIPNWNNEFDKWAPEVRKIVYKGDPNHRKQLQLELRHENFQVLLTTFEYIIKDKNVLSRFKWVHTIIDEGHRMKNATSKLSVTLNQFYSSRNRLILTGTPLQNNLPELWALLNFILPKVFNSVSTFEEWFNSPFSNQGGQDKIALNEEEQLLIIKRLHKVLRPFLLRRLKKDVESELPDKKEHIIRCRMSALQSRLYSQMKQHKNLFLSSGSGGKPRMTGLNNTLMQLRKICNHPYVFQEVEQVINPTNRNDSKLYRVAGKFELLDRMLPKLFEFGHRCLIFFQMTQVMTIMEDFLAYRGIKYLRLDGTTKHDDRSNMLTQFNAPDSEIEVFLLSTRAGGLGLNLQTADTVIIFDSDWNPHQDLQAQDRAHRIGQKKEVRIFRLITANSVEEKILERAQYKLDMDGKVIQAGRFDNKTTEQEREEILKGCFAEDDEDDADDEDFNDEILNSMIARSDTEKQRFAQMDKERADREKHEHSLNGGTGPIPDRLVQDYELPDVYLQDHNSEDASTPVEVLGRGQRARERVFYDDGLTEEQYADAVDSGNLDELVAKNRVRQLKREAKRMKKSGANSSKEPSPSITSPSAMDTPGSQGNRGRPKRKRGNDDATDTPATPPVQSRSHRPGSANSLPSHVRRVVQHTLNQVYAAIQDVTDPDYPDYPNRPRWEIFAELPDENDYADYYQLIQNPIAMDIIKKRIEKHYYKDVVTFRNDWHLMFNNARTYNVEESQVYQDADELQRVLDDKLDELCPGNQFPDIDPNDLPQAKKRGRKPQSRLAASPNVDSIRSSPSATSADHRPHRSNKRVLHDDDDSDGNN
jgi:ATP-dependent helicase STH1/SNF2